MKSISSSTVAVIAASAVQVAADVAQQVASLRLAPTEVDRLNVLQDPGFVFDFLNPPSGVVTGAGGHTVEASSANFAAVVGNGVAMTIGFLGPCGLNTPHTHPRATEINFSVNGTLQTGLLVENGARFISNELKPGMATVFPQGAIHFEMNTGCEPATFVAAFNNEDPGVLSLAQRFFGLPPSIVSLALGDLGVEEVASLNSKIPDNIVLGVSECQKRCGITVPTQPTKQQQPRVSGNALPSDFTAPPAPSTSPLASFTFSPTASGTASSSTASATPPNNQNFAENSNSKFKTSGNVGDSDNDNNSNGSSLSPVVIALIVVVSILAVGYIVIAIMFFRRRSQNQRETRAAWAAISTPPTRMADYRSQSPLGEYGGVAASDEKGYYDPHPTGRTSLEAASLTHADQTPTRAEH